MLWSNTQTIQPATYTRPPIPEVLRRFEDPDPIARVASEAVERAISYSIDVHDLDGVLRQCSFDFVLFARGQTWERYVPTFGPEVMPPPVQLQVTTNGDSDDAGYEDDEGNTYAADQVTTGDDGAAIFQGAPYQPVTFEDSVTDYVNWEDFLYGVSRTWDEVGWVARRVYLSRDELVDRFGAIGKLVPLDWGPVAQGQRDADAKMLNKAAIYEIWDKATKEVCWISKSWSSRPLDRRPDPLGLPDFFPCPRPLLGTTANDSTIPVPDYVFYQDQAEEIDTLTGRIAKLQDGLKVRGFYAGDAKTNLNSLLNSDTNILIPVKDWQGLKEEGGLRGKIEWWPLEQVVAALNALIAQRQQLIEDVYQITGVSDIMRGQSDPGETFGAQNIKATFGSMRVRDRQIEMQRFARDVLRIKGAVIAGKFSGQTLKACTNLQLPTNAEKAQVQQQIAAQQQQAQVAAMQAQAQHAAVAQQAQAAGQPPPPPPQAPPPPQVPPQVQLMLQSPSWEDVEALLQDSASRRFRIDIETDSTIEPNDAMEKADTAQFMQALGAMASQWGPMIQAQPVLAPLVGELIKFGARKFKAGRRLEEVIDGTMDKLVQMASQGPPAGAAAQPPPDQTPVQVAVLNQQTEQIKQQGETQRAVINSRVEQSEQAVRVLEAQAHAAVPAPVAPLQ
jgi:hypothetical protein